MERILRYSLDHRRPIRLIFQRGGALQQRNVQVLALEAGRVRRFPGGRGRNGKCS